MKKLLTLVFALGTLSVSFAQNRDYRPSRDDRYESRNDNRNDRRYDDAFKMTTRERDELVKRINRDYNDRIESVRRKWLMNSHDKRRLISSLEAEKSAKISAVYARFSDRRNRFNDGYSYNNDNRRNW